MNKMPEEWGNLKDHIEREISPKIPVSEKNAELEAEWEASLPYIGRAFPDEWIKFNVEPGEKFIKGQIVGIENDNELKCGMILSCSEEGRCEVLVGKKSGELVTERVEENELAPLKEKLTPIDDMSWDSETILAVKEKLQTQKEMVQEIASLFDTVNPIALSEGSLFLINDSFPLVWGSCSVEGEPFQHGIRGERIIRGNAVLGKDIEVVFTDHEHVKALENAVKPYGITVLSFDAARYIMTRQAKFSNYGMM
jgi:hypothetical protein